MSRSFVQTSFTHDAKTIRRLKFNFTFTDVFNDANKSGTNETVIHNSHEVQKRF
jgi:hypothetical protein